jgi:hypothetical protein
VVLLFEKEEDMYSLIGKYFEEHGYNILIDKPRGSGIKFKSLKGWTIDVVGVKKGENSEVVAVEAKNSLDSSSVLDALSKAEMYRNVCTRVYVAFPKDDLHSKDNKETVREIRQECERRGIGMLEIGKECKPLLSAVPSSLRIDMFRDILLEFEKRAKKFNGFEEEDFARYYSDIEDEVVWHKFELLIEEVEKRLNKKGLVRTHEARGTSWWYSFSKKLHKDERYFDVPHFTISFWGEGIMVELIAREGPYLNGLRKRIKQNPKLFKQMLLRLKSNIPCEIKVRQRVFIGGYQTETSSEYVVYSQHIDESSIKYLTHFLEEKRQRGKMWLWIGHLFHLKDGETHSWELTNYIEKFIVGLIEIYDFIVGK